MNLATYDIEDNESLDLLNNAMKIKQYHLDTSDTEYALLLLHKFTYYARKEIMTPMENHLEAAIKLYQSLPQKPFNEFAKIIKNIKEIYCKNSVMQNCAYLDKVYISIVSECYPKNGLQWTNENYELGLSAYMKSDYENAIKYWSRCNIKKVKDHFFFQKLGTCYTKSNQYDLAINCFLKDHELYNGDEFDEDNFAFISEALMKKQQYDKAYIAIKKYEKLKPGNIAAKHWVMYYCLIGHNAKALKYLDRMTK